MYNSVFVPYPEIYTDRLLLRMVRRSDDVDLFEHCRRPETSQYSLWSPHESIDVTRQLIAFQISQYKKRRCTFFVVEHKESGRVIGTGSYVYIDENYKVAEIGYSIRSDCWGQGYATEVVDALTGFAFDRMLVQRVYARVLPENEASSAVLLKLGFEYEGTHKKEYYFEGKVSDVEIYAITDEMYWQLEEKKNEIKKDSEL